FGFGKQGAHNLALLLGLPSLAQLGLPLVVGLSRKSLLQALTGRAVGDRLAGSIALATLAAWRGARIIRAHDVAETHDAMRVVAAVQAAAPAG
ncbi:MAG: dihydropteroate synthase, partial [Pseudomonadota bacterium]